MRFSGFVPLLLLHSLTTLFAAAQTQWPLHDDGLNSVVEWDHYSYIINGERLYIWSGEMHYWRVPVPEIWLDILQKVKAAGFNTVSFYGNWAYHSPKNGTVDFETGAHNFTRLFEITKQVGLYVLFRPGPYINAEASAGGFPGWLTTGEYGSTRNNDTRYTEAWTPYISGVSKIISDHQVTNGGNVFIYQIENEYGQQWINSATKTPNETAIAYMELLEASARSNGIDVPLVHNNPNMNTKSWSKDFSNEGGNVDIYGLDHYPSCWSCNLTECIGTNGAVPDFTVYEYFTNFQQVAPTQPSFMAEFQGGSYNPWGGPQGGCVNNTGPDWVNVYYRHNVAEKISAMNVYMAFGGTSWGGISMPSVGTSYDYSAPISETRLIGDKYYETKLFGQFLRVARDLTKVDMAGNSTLYTSTPEIYTTELRNPDTNGAFYVTIHTDSPSTNLTSFKLHVSTSAGNITVPQGSGSITLNGRESKIIVTDFAIGKERLIYSTAEVLTVSTVSKKPIVFLWLPSGESGEFLISGARKGSVARRDGTSGVKFTASTAGVIASFVVTSGTSIFEFDNGIQVAVLDRAAAYHTWMPTLTNNPHSYDNSTVVVQGPYLVRDVSLERRTLSLTGDWASNETSIEVFAPKNVKILKFNGSPVNVKRTSYGSLVGHLPRPHISVDSLLAQLPALSDWKVNDGLPEKESNYDESKWIAADHMTTMCPSKPETYPVLYSDDYGYHMGNILWRGRFPGASATGIYLSVVGGTSSGWSAYLNGDYIGSFLGSTGLTTTSLNLTFANATLSNTTNVLFVIQDHMGKDETSGVLNPRGISNATLLGPTAQNFTSWKVAGKAGGDENIDPVRGTYNEGGLHAERLGWHLPGFDDGSWGAGSPVDGFSGAGAKFYRTVVPLDIPEGIDASLGFILNVPQGAASTFRAQLYVNGYMFGKFVPWIGNQISFPVFPGILDYHGDNTIGVSVWSMDVAPAKLKVDWAVLGVVESSYDLSFDSSYLRPNWTDRSMYA
ncbi:hypothetical protein BP5796_06500 [Coleophoma crateriformis]|uniref:beta-galactosidase n=1 Tax=Coleophoma crateriformis TaxID=565419 RepID=A0A3D8RNQ0_9HELO|nr:hypothetical protein BP5796_06500 [Coleophoma crateriformis]